MPPTDDRRQAIALFRYSLIREAADPALGTRERGALVRALAERDHLGPTGERVRVSRNTLDRWIRGWRVGGFPALLPDPRVGRPRVEAELLQLAVTLKREQPRRAASQIAAVIAERHGHSPHERTLQRHFRRVGLDRELTAQRGGLRAFGRFEAEAPNQLWTADALHGPAVAGRKAYLFAAIDDHSRALVGYRWATAEDTLRLEAALRAGFAARGLPGALYVDNGSPFISRQLERVCAVLGIRLTHSKPRWSGSFPAHHRGCPAPPSCGRRSCGPSTARSPSRRWSACSATATRSTPPWSARPWSWSSTPSTWATSRSATSSAPWARRSPSSSAATSTRTPPPTRPSPSRHGPAGSTTWPWSSSASPPPSAGGSPTPPCPSCPPPPPEPAPTILPPPSRPAPATPPGSRPRPPPPTSGCTRPPPSRRTRKTSQQSAAPPPSPSPTSSPPTPTRTSRR